MLIICKSFLKYIHRFWKHCMTVCAIMLFTHLLAVDQSAPSLPSFSCSLPLPEMCQNSLGFLPCLPGGGGISLGNVSHSWQLESCWCSWSQAALLRPQPPFVFCCWPTTCALGGEGVRIGAADSSPRWKVLPNWPRSFTVNGHVLNAHVEFLTKGRNVCFPLPGPQNVRKARYLCGWILGSLLVKRSNFLIQQVRQGNCSLTQGGSCQNKHIGDNVSQLIFLSCFFSTYFPPLPFRHFLSCMCQQQHRDHYFRYKTR